MEKEKIQPISRRDFLATGAIAATALSGFPFIRTAQAQGAKIRIGVIGAGGRGTGACSNALVADPNVELVAMADIAADQIEKSLAALKADRDLQGEAFQKRIKVTKDMIFAGPDAFKQLLATDIDYVILATPPGFRPLHFEEAVLRGKHIFAEKPVATDAVGCRKIRVSAQKAKEKGLSVVVGLNARHDKGVVETVKRLHDGALGTILAGSIHRLGGGLWHRGSDPRWSQMEYQCRNWYYFCWLSGDQIVEMVVHQIDLMNWALGAHPISALGQGGRQVRTDPKYGNIWDHMTIDYEYPNDVHVFCMLRQWENCDNANDNRVIGTLGESNSRDTIKGQNRWRYREKDDSSVYEHQELIESIRKSAARNDCLDFAIDSTLTAILGRESAYTGKTITWDEMANSTLDLFPKSYQLGPAPQQPVPMPGSPRPL